MKKLWKKSIALLCAAAAAVQMLSLHAFAIEPDSIQVLAIGDDCLVPTEGSSAADILAAYYNGTAVNRAEVGMKASDLLSDLEKDTALQKDVQESDVILVSVGVNDLIAPILYENKDLIDASQYSTLAALAKGLTREGALMLDARLYNTMPGVVANTANTITAAMKKLRQLNPCANVVVQTINNPLAVDFDVMQKDWGISDNRTAAVSELYRYMNVYLQGGTTSGGTKIPVGLNQTIEGLSRVTVSDFYEPYIGASGEYSMGLILSDIENMNMRFKPVGQVLIAAAAISSDDGLSGGSGSAVIAAYTATGMDSLLASDRASMDTIIRSCEGNTTETYALGDITANGKIDMQDAYHTLIQSSMISLGERSSFSPACRKAADADGDNKITMQDAYLWLIYSSMQSLGIDKDLEEYLKENGRP